MIVAALQNEPLDALVWRATGQGASALPAVLAANPGLAASGTALAEGTPVTIPDLPATTVEIELVQLWN